MKYSFWCAATLIVYTYLGYAAWLWVRSRLRPKPVKRAPYLPAISVVMVIRNEERVLERKLQNLSALEYPQDSLEIVVVSDGSTDKTNSILQQASDAGRLRAILLPEGRGKASSLNHGMAAARGDVIVFTDARQHLEPGSVRLLLENFADPSVGCVSGELMLGDPQNGESKQGMGLYWAIEKKIRELEAASGSVVGATGAFYAVRRCLAGPLPEDTILDDVLTPMNVVRQGARVIFDSRALAWDEANLGSRREFRRKVRTLAGNYQLLQLGSWLLTGKNPVRFEFVSHKLLRLIIPLALLVLLFSSAMIHGWFYRAILAAQITMYTLSALSLLGWKLGPLSRLADAAATFVALNAAAAVAFSKVVGGRRVVWMR